MNKNEFIRAIANNAGITLKEASTAYDAFIQAVTDGLKNGEKIQLSGFGTFEVKNKPARERINPLTGEKIHVEATKAPNFTFGKAYKDGINE